MKMKDVTFIQLIRNLRATLKLKNIFPKFFYTKNMQKIIENNRIKQH